MLKKFISIFLSFALFSALTACGSKNEEPAAVPVETTPPAQNFVPEEDKTVPNDVLDEELAVSFFDATGTSVTVAKNPENVAVLFSSFADIWKTAGGNVSITVKETVERGFADSSAVLVDDGAGKTINTELLIASNPDFVICSADIEAQADAAEICRKAGIPTACVKVECFEDYLSVLKTFTEITDSPAAYKTYGTDIEKRIDDLKIDYISDASPKTVLFIRAGSGSSATKAKTADDHFAAWMLSELGTVNIADSAPVLLDGLSFEEVLERDPEFIFISTMGDEDAAQSYINSVFSEDTWQSLTAVQEGNVIFLPKDLFQYKPNAKWAEAYEYMINVLEGNE